MAGIPLAGVRLQIWVCLICVISVALISPYSNGAVQIRVGLELAERTPSFRSRKTHTVFRKRGGVQKSMGHKVPFGRLGC